MYAAASPLRPEPAAPRVHPEALAARVWARCRAAGTAYTEHEVRGLIVPAYVEACAAATLDPVLAIAQMMHETGSLTSWWSAKPRRNPAGVFVTGAKRSAPNQAEPGLWHRNPETGLYHRGGAWPNWLDTAAGPGSVSAHVWRLAGYALPAFSPTQQARYNAAVAGRPLPEKARGSALALRELGWAFNRRRLEGAGWAFPGWGYGDALAALANVLTQGLV